MKLCPSELEYLRNSVDPAEAVQKIFDDTTYACEVPLDDFCTMGGMPDEDDSPEISIESAEFDGGFCRGSLTAYFNEVAFNGGCPDYPTVEARTGDVLFKINLSDGNVEFE